MQNTEFLIKDIFVATLGDNCIVTCTLLCSVVMYEMDNKDFYFCFLFKVQQHNKNKLMRILRQNQKIN